MTAPVASFILLAYNQEQFVAEALRAAFAQTARPLEIVVCDDSSTDGTWSVLEAVAAECPSDIRLVSRRHPVNLGLARNFAAAVSLASGDVVIAAAGDDVSEPDRVTQCLAAFDDRSVFAVVSSVLLVDETGRTMTQQPTHEAGPTTAAEMARSGGTLYGCALAYRRAVFDAFDALPPDLINEDIVLGFRAALLGRITVLPARLVRYRQHGGSLIGSSKAIAPSANAYARGVRRHTASMVAVRRSQLADLDQALAQGLFEIEPGHEMRRHLESYLEDVTLDRSLQRWQPMAIRLLIEALATGRRSLRGIVKAIAMNATPRLWYWWIRRTAR